MAAVHVHLRVCSFPSYGWATATRPPNRLRTAPAHRLVGQCEICVQKSRSDNVQAQRSTQETSRLRLHGHALEQGVELHWVRSPRLVVDAQTGASGLSLKVWYDAVRRLAGKRCQGYKGAMTASNLLHFWGTPLLFPTVALAAFSLASVPWKRKALHFLLAAWLAWVAAFPVIDVAIRLHRNPEAPGDWHLADVFVHLCLWD